MIPRQDRVIGPIERALLNYIPPLRWRKRAEMMDYRESFYEAVTDSESAFAGEIRRMCITSMQAQLPDKPELWKSLTPDYSPGCKRVLMSDDYYPALNRKHVYLETRPIKRITGTGIETLDNELREFDLIVTATGFRSVEFLYPIQIHGVNGRALSDIWKDGAVAYCGMTVEDLPNFAMLYGPNTNLGAFFRATGIIFLWLTGEKQDITPLS